MRRSDSANSKRKSEFEVARVFIVVVAAAWMLFFVSAAFDRNVLTSWLFSGITGYDMFMDFFNTVHDACVRGFDGAYNSIYLPVVNLFYTLLAYFAPDMIASDVEGRAAGRTASCWIEFVLCSIAMLVLLAIVIWHSLRGSNRQKMLLTLTVLCSMPSVYSLSRGNNVLMSVFFILLFLYWKESDSSALRQLALVSLALAACMKIYPIAFALVLIRDRKWRETGLLFLYVAVLSIVPFFAFQGFDTMRELYRNLGDTTDIMVGSGFGYYVNLSGTVALLCAVFNGGSFALDPSISLGIQVLLVISLFGCFMLREDWETLTLIGLVIALIPSFSAQYNAVFIFPGLIAFLRQADRLDTGRIVAYSILFLLVLIPIPFGQSDCIPYLAGSWRVTTCCLVCRLALAAMWVMLFSESIDSGIRTMREKALS